MLMLRQWKRRRPKSKRATLPPPPPGDTLSLFDFARTVLGLTLLTEEHRSWCDFLMDFSCKKRVMIFPRNTFKSSLGIAWIIYLLTRPEVLGKRGRDLKFLLLAASERRAKELLRSCGQHLLRNPRLEELHGELVDPSVDVFNAFQIMVKGRTQVAERSSSLMCGSVETVLTGLHADFIWADDVCSPADRSSEFTRLRTIEFIRNTFPILDPATGIYTVVGTPYHPADVLGEIEETWNPALREAGEPEWKILRQPAYREDGSLAFPTILSEEKLRGYAVQLGSISFSSQYLLRALPRESSVFAMEDLKFEFIPDGAIVKTLGYCDLAFSKSQKADYTALVIAQVDERSRTFIVEAVVKRVNLETLAKIFVDVFRRYKFSRMAIEAGGPSLAGVQYLEDCLLPVIGSYSFQKVTHSGDKNSRINAAENKIKGCFFRPDWRTAYPEGIAQLVSWPHGHDDFPDALEGICALIDQDRQSVVNEGVMKLNLDQKFSFGMSETLKSLETESVAGANTASLLAGNW